MYILHFTDFKNKQRQPGLLGHVVRTLSWWGSFLREARGADHTHHGILGSGQKLHRVARRTEEDSSGKEKRLGAQRKDKGQESTIQGGLGNGTRDITGTMSGEKGLLQL